MLRRESVLGVSLMSSLLCVIGSCLLVGCGGSSGTSISSTIHTVLASKPPVLTTPTTHATTTPTRSSTSTSTNTSTPPIVNEIKHYGKAAPDNEREEVSKAVKAYYLALSTRNFHTACSLLSAQIKRLVLSSIEQNPLMRGKGCVGIFTAMVGRNPHSSLSPEVAVHSVRLYRNEKGFALISTKDRRSGQIRIEREHGAWKIGSLIGGPLR